MNSSYTYKHVSYQWHPYKEKRGKNRSQADVNLLHVTTEESNQDDS